MVAVHHSTTNSADTWQTPPRVEAIDGVGAYSCTVEFETDDSREDEPQTESFTFFRRERPELIFNDDGNPTHLLTGVEYFADHPGEGTNHQYSFVLVQEVDLD